jgi:hypothetical protein
MEDEPLTPRRINQLRSEADAAFAMLAGMQLDLFTPLKNRPMTAEQIVAAIGVAPTTLRLLLYCLVAAGLLTEHNGKFANTPEANQFLVKRNPSYMGNKHGNIAHRWSSCFKTAESIRSGVPQAKLDFSNSPLRTYSSGVAGSTFKLLARPFTFKWISFIATCPGNLRS